MPTKIKIKTEEKERTELAKKLALRRERLHKEIEEKREEDIESSLSEIYRDTNGERIDVNRMKIKKKAGFVFWFFNFLIFGLVAIVVVLGVYYYIVYGKGTDSTAVDLKIEAPEAITAGEEFTYIIKYKNSEYVALKSANLKVTYPENFIFIDSTPKPAAGDNAWNLIPVGSRGEGEVKITGRIINQPKSNEIILAQLAYIPENFNSEFKKEISFNSTIKDIGFEADFQFSNTALVNEQGEIRINFKALEKNFLPNFILRLEKDKNFEVKNTIVNGGIRGEKDKKREKTDFKIEKISAIEGDSWFVSGLNQEENNFQIIYKIKEKIADQQTVRVYFDEEVGGKKYTFFKKEIPLEVMKSDLNLTLIMNGSQADQPINFDDTLNYSIVYANKGEAAMNEVAITAVLSSDFLDWTTLSDPNNGREAGNTITWTKKEIPALEKLEVDENGTIDFSIKVLPFKENDLRKNFSVKCYAQYAIGSLEGEVPSTTAKESDNQSNTINNAINSDLTLKEEVRYFDENNMPVGNGPLPPKVGEKTSFKVYWTISNNLHELNETAMGTILPAGVEWDEHNRTSVGSVAYDQNTRQITWQIGRLPITVFRADAEFNISLTPKEEDRNKIIVLLTGSNAQATDFETGAAIKKNTAPKTTKLEDDEIAGFSSDGRVR